MSIIKQKLFCFYLKLFDLDDVTELSSTVVKVLADVVVKLDPGPRHLGIENISNPSNVAFLPFSPICRTKGKNEKRDGGDLRDQRHATSAARAGTSRGGDFLHRASPALQDGQCDFTLRDVVACRRRSGKERPSTFIGLYIIIYHDNVHVSS